jgi:hypothetical protein
VTYEPSVILNTGVSILIGANETYFLIFLSSLVTGESNYPATVVILLGFLREPWFFASLNFSVDIGLLTEMVRGESMLLTPPLNVSMGNKEIAPIFACLRGILLSDFASFSGLVKGDIEPYNLGLSSSETMLLLIVLLDPLLWPLPRLGII